VLISAHADLRIEANISRSMPDNLRFDANGQGQKWNGSSVESWQDNDPLGPPQSRTTRNAMMRPNADIHTFMGKISWSVPMVIAHRRIA